MLIPLINILDYFDMRIAMKSERATVISISDAKAEYSASV